MALSVDVYPPAIVPARNPVVFQISADIGSPQKQNHRIGLQVLRREGNLDVLVFEDLVTPWFNGNRAIARFEISELLITSLRSDFNLHESAGFHIRVSRPDVLKPFFIKYYEEFGDPATVDVVKTSRWFYSLFGGVPTLKQVEIFDSYDNLTKYFNLSNRLFLSWHWFPKVTDTNAPERLYLIVPREPGTSNFVLRVTRHYFDDGDEFEDFNLGHTLQLGQAFEVDVSYKAVIESHASNFSGYSIQVISVDESFFSEEFHFNMDFRWLPNLRYFMFLNSLGAYECVRFTGEAIHDLSFTRQMFLETDLQEYASDSASRGQTLPEVIRGFKVNTGWISKEEVLWMQDFLSSQSVFEIKGTRRIPVLIRQDKTELYKDASHLNALTIEMEYIDLPTVFQRDPDLTWQDVAEVVPPYQED